ncbi:hypothetical protein LSUE1_G004188 [Lachnellula suecica]|uniref:BTB domain-containing protein n=1 Tax=Lachnellula suecica TaxID=602035 RepID=A0A8T9C7N1_9HELO|nr:hypothetical protein LSUE1_G004188 [Lachnellula suecica]
MAWYQLPPAPPPIIFTSAQSPANVRLRVFYQDFHVHADVLKKQSAFFRAFLNSPDKAVSGTSANKEFEYDWRTQVDLDGTWSLVCVTKLEVHDEDTSFWGDEDAEIIAFYIVLRAMYGMPLRIRSIPKLEHIIKLADYYRSLPSLSRALSNSLERGTCPRLLDGIIDTCTELLGLAIKVRCAVLYRECLILAMSPMPKMHPITRQRNETRGTEEVRSIVDIEDKKALRKWVLFISLLDPVQTVARNNNTPNRPAPTTAAAHGASVPTWAPMVPLPGGLWASAPAPTPTSARVPAMVNCPGDTADLLKKYNRFSNCKGEGMDILRQVSKNNLTLVPEKAYLLKDHWLYLEVKGEELPWDIKQTDW